MTKTFTNSVKVLTILFIFLNVFCIQCFADEEVNITDSYDFTEVEDFVNQNFESENIDFYSIVKELMSGKSENVFKNVFKGIKKSMICEVEYNSKALQKVIMVAIISAIFTSFSKVFSNNQISETGFNISYILITAILVASFTVLSHLAFDVVGKLLEFMKALLPIYMVSVGVAIGQAGASSFYSISLIVVTVVETICLKFMLPAINVYVLIELLNNISKEDFLSKLTELIKNTISFCIKALITLVLGINVIQGMLIPVSSNIRNNAAKNVIGILTGSMSAATNITGLLYGTSSLIKNAIGGAGLIVIFTIILIPIIKIVIFIFTYQFANVIIQPVSDKRIINSLQGVSSGAIMLLRTVFMCAILFIITVAIICMTTN